MANEKITDLASAPGAVDPTDEVIITSVNGTLGRSYRRPVSELEILFQGQNVGLGHGWNEVYHWDQSIDGDLTAAFDVINLDGCSDAIITMIGITKSGSASMRAYCSVNNGSSFYTTSGDYVSFSNGAPGNQADFNFGGGSTNAARTQGILITNLQGNPLLITPENNTGQPSRMFVASPAPVNALRIGPSGAVNLTAGIIRVFARSSNFRKQIFVVSALPTVGVGPGDCAIVTDASSPVLGAVVVGGGSTMVGVFYDGTDWRVGA